VYIELDNFCVLLCCTHADNLRQTLMIWNGEFGTAGRVWVITINEVLLFDYLHVGNSSSKK
jgi:hypothetical protein